MNNLEELKKAALGANLHGWTGFEDALNADGYSEAVSKFIGHCSPSAILALIAQLEAAQKERDEMNGILNIERGGSAFASKRTTHIDAMRDKWQARAKKAEAALSAASDKLSKPVVLPAGYAVRAGHPINEGERNFMIPKEGGRWLSRLDVEHAIRVAGFTVKEGATPIVIVPAPDGVIMRPQSENPLERCAAGRDGECHHKGCPQLRDNEPMATGRHCPIDNWDDE